MEFRIQDCLGQKVYEESMFHCIRNKEQRRWQKKEETILLTTVIFLHINVFSFVISYSGKKKYLNHRQAGVSGLRIDETYVSSGATRTTIACSRLQKLIVMCKDHDCMTDAKNERWQRFHARLIFATSQILGEPGTGYKNKQRSCMPCICRPYWTVP